MGFILFFLKIKYGTWAERLEIGSLSPRAYEVGCDKALFLLRSHVQDQANHAARDRQANGHASQEVSNRCLNTFYCLAGAD